MKLKYTLLLSLALSLPMSTLTASAQSVNVRPTKKTNTNNATKTNKTKKQTNNSNKPSGSNKTNKQANNIKPNSTSASSSKGLSQQTLYTFASGETINMSEYVGSQKLSSTNFGLLTNYNGNMRLIVNGRVVGEGRYISLDHLDIESATPSYAFYMYDGTNRYINANGKMYGPFSSLRDYLVHVDNPSAVEITYEKMGMQFVQGYDGKTTQLEKGQSAYDVSSPYVAMSPNGSYRVQRSDNNCTLHINGKRVQLWQVGTKDVKIFGIMPSNNGHVKVFTSAYPNGKYEWREVGIQNHSSGYNVLICGDGLYFDLASGSIVPYSDEYASREGKIRRPYIAPLYSFGMDWDKGKLKTQYYLQTADRNHEFVGNWQYDYVSIDNQAYGKSYPLDAWYESSANAFVWVGLDGNRLVRYTYRF